MGTRALTLIRCRPISTTAMGLAAPASAHPGGRGTRQSSNRGLAQATDRVYVQPDQPDALNVRGASPMKLTLHHNVLIASTLGPTESTSPGSVATVMLWAIPASVVR
jgi:hypothetical protein